MNINTPKSPKSPNNFMDMDNFINFMIMTLGNNFPDSFGDYASGAGEHLPCSDRDDDLATNNITCIESEHQRQAELREAFIILKQTLPKSNTKCSQVTLVDRATGHLQYLETAWLKLFYIVGMEERTTAGTHESYLNMGKERLTLLWEWE
ncbi:hypothetical protein L208DRAFT_1376257 [Tricholoma matsutake]|nr:hypothetical protein L208DRAFT_1376257 [Tricholoma matsutake 945]